jgi:hypothetical protein
MIPVSTGGENVQQRTGTDPERELKRTGDELEERIDHLDDRIGEARREAQARHEDQDPLEETAGDWEDTDDDAGGEDPGAFDDPEDVDPDLDESEDE